MRTLIRYFFFYLATAFFFIVFNYLLDLLFFKIDYGNTDEVMNGLAYLAYFIAFYTPIFLPFLILYNYAVNELFLINEQRWMRYGIALLLGLLAGGAIGRGGISYYIGSYRPLKNIILFPLIMMSLEITRDVVRYFRNKRRKVPEQTKEAANG
jgi:hypothetical protein